MTLIFDTETTGKVDFNLPPEAKSQPRLVQLGAILVDKDFNTRAEINLIIKPIGFVIPPEVAKIHGITQDIANEYGVDEYMALSIFRSLAQAAKTLVAHNIVFDAHVIGRACAVNEFNFLPPENKFCTMREMTDVCKIYSGKKPGFKFPSLQEAYRHCFGKQFDGAHDAMADVRACLAVYKWLQQGPPPVEDPLGDPEVTKLDDLSPMPFGKHKGTPMQDVPADYLHWLWSEGCNNLDVKSYIERNLSALKKETPDKIWN